MTDAERARAKRVSDALDRCEKLLQDVADEADIDRSTLRGYKASFVTGKNRIGEDACRRIAIATGDTFEWLWAGDGAAQPTRADLESRVTHLRRSVLALSAIVEALVGGQAVSEDLLRELAQECEQLA